MSSAHEDEMIQKFQNDIEFTLFNKDGVVNNEILEQIENCQVEASEVFDDIKKTLAFLSDGDYENTFNGTFTRCILCLDKNYEKDYSSFIKEQISKQLSSAKSVLECYLRQLHILLLGISSLHLVIQQNWLGPPLNKDEMHTVSKYLNLEEKEELVKHQVSNYLRRDGEDVYILGEYFEYLLIARTILVDSRDSLWNLKSQPLWEMRCNYVHQQLLEDISPSLKTEVTSALERINFNEENLPSETLFRMRLETGLHFLQYSESGKAKELFEVAQKCVGIELYLEGALGKRTKFQQIDYAQLLAKTKIDDSTENGEQDVLDLGYLPKDLMLDDDTLLNKTKLTNPDNDTQDKLTSLHLAAILAVCFHKQKSQAHQELLAEELLANVTLLLSQPRVWSIQSVALLLRSKYERNSSRRKERSMMQIQELVDQYSGSKAKISQRLELFFSVFFPTRWELQRELASLYLELGVVKSALDVYERLQLWEDVIHCYISLGRFEKAESVVRSQLSINETPKLWCLLGDVTKDEAHYMKAWDISGHRNARAQRSLGFLYLRDKKFEESIPCFQKSLEINSLQENVWFSLGCAAMVIVKLDVASKAFHRCVSMNPDNSEAWSNLSSVYIKMKQNQPESAVKKPHDKYANAMNVISEKKWDPNYSTFCIDRAFRTLQEALRANYNNWQMWENFLVVSTDVGAFEQVIQALHRLMNLKEKYLDVEVLGILVQSVISDKEDNKGLPGSRLKARVKKLMGRITSQVTSNAEVWKLYSDLYKDGESEEEKDKFLQFLVKANGINIQSPGWEKTQEKIENVVKITLELSQAYHDIAHGQETKRAIQLLSSSKLNLRGLLATLKKNADYQISEEMDKCFSESLSKLEAELEKTLNAIDILKSASNR